LGLTLAGTIINYAGDIRPVTVNIANRLLFRNITAMDVNDIPVVTGATAMTLLVWQPKN